VNNDLSIENDCRGSERYSNREFPEAEACLGNAAKTVARAALRSRHEFDFFREIGKSLCRRSPIEIKSEERPSSSSSTSRIRSPTGGGDCTRAAAKISP